MAHSSGPQDRSSKTPVAPKTHHLLWLAHNIDKLQQDFAQSFSSLDAIAASMTTFSATELFMSHVFDNSHKKIIVLIAGALGENNVPVIHDAPQLEAIFVFCINQARHEKWAKNWSKVAGVFQNIDAMCGAVRQTIRKSESTRLQPTASAAQPSSGPPRPLTPQPLPPPPRAASPSVPTGSAESSHDDKDKPSKDEEHSSHRRRRGRSAQPRQPKDEATTDHPESLKPLTRMPDPLKKIVGTKARDDDNPSTSPAARKHEPTAASHASPSRLDKLRDALVTTTEQKIRDSLLHQMATSGDASLEAKIVDQLQRTLKPTTASSDSSKVADANELGRMFADLKQSLIDALIQQQPKLLHDLIEQSVADALKQHQPHVSPPPAPSVPAMHRQPVAVVTSREVKISADPKKTRTDAAFRQERDAVVAKKHFRDTVRRWSTVDSMSDLVTKIKSCGLNNLERSWLLFCWIGENIKYAPNCNINAANTVFQRRQGVCRGFASLFHECCSLLGIDCFEISGYAKNTFVHSFDELKKAPHAWNSIVLDDRTYLLDPTWGAGGREHETILEDFYFLTSPEEFIYSHYCIGNQLLQPEVSIEEFLTLPVMHSAYYRYGLQLLSPKQGFNETNGNLFRVVLRTPKHVQLTASLTVGREQYPRSLHVLCQRDDTNPDLCNCLIAPPLNGLYDVDIYAKTSEEKSFQGVINMRLRVSSIADAFTFPPTYLTFTEHNCVLIAPLQHFVYKNEEVLIHMLIPQANVVKIQNGDHYMVPDKDEYKRGILKKKVLVQGNIQICARWDANADTISIICVFHMA